MQGSTAFRSYWALQRSLQQSGGIYSRTPVGHYYSLLCAVSLAPDNAKEGATP